MCVSGCDQCPPSNPGCLIIVTLSPHYYSGHKRPDNPTLPTSGAPGLGKFKVIMEIFKHSFANIYISYPKKFIPAADLNLNILLQAIICVIKLANWQDIFFEK